MGVWDVNRDVSRKDKHHLLLCRFHNRKTAVFTRVKARRPRVRTGERWTGERRTISAYALCSLIDCSTYICSPEGRRSVLVSAQAWLVPRVWARSRP